MQCRALNFCFSVEMERSSALTQSLGTEPSPSVPDPQLPGKDTYLLLWTQLYLSDCSFLFHTPPPFSRVTRHRCVLLQTHPFGQLCFSLLPSPPLLPARVLFLYITPLLVGLAEELQHQQRFLAFFLTQAFPSAPDLVSFAAGSSCLFSNPSLPKPLAVLWMPIVFSWIPSLLTRD